MVLLGIDARGARNARRDFSKQHDEITPWWWAW